MTPTEQTKAAAAFAEFWAGKGDEKQETSRFWIDLLQNVLGIENPAKYIEFEKRVKLSHTSFIDAYIPDTKVLIEQKGAKIDLHRAYEQSDGSVLTPYEQAKRYADEMPNSLRPRWIVVCNFQEFLVYDLEKPGCEPEQIFLKDIEKEHYRLQFLADVRHDYLRREEELSLQAGVLVGKLYDALIKQYINPKDEQSLRSLNILCVRLVFCLYAEDAGLFATRTAFEDYIRSFAIENTRDAIIKLFKALDTKIENRDRYDTKLQPFPYVNGGLFAAENIEIPNFTNEIIDVLCDHCAPFNWSAISPTIFGAVFESTLNPETRRRGGMHYTSVQNIHKVIDPLFMDGLNAEFETISKDNVQTRRTKSLQQFQQKLGSLRFLDPACGSGNFLTETYLSLRRLENKVLCKLSGGTGYLFEDIIHVKISQFYGIEINDFAVTVAKTALWIAESQMIRETETILSQNIDFLPLTTNAFIVEGNALRMDWATLKPIDTAAAPIGGLFSGFTTETDGDAHHYDYIIGNPPFVGHQWRSEEQQSDMDLVFADLGANYGKLDYVCCWYKKACDLMQNTKTKCAFVSTNSIVQGESVPTMWKPLFEKCNLQIDFAWRTFRWDSESNQKAHVHCVIVGFSCRDALNASADAKNADARGASLQRRIFNADDTVIDAKNINAYLLDAPNVWIENRGKSLTIGMPKMTKGSQATDDMNLMLSIEERDLLIEKYPQTEKFIKRIIGAEDYINNKTRYCLWLKGVSPNEYAHIPTIIQRLEAVKQTRLKSPTASVRRDAETPMLFTQIRQPETDYMVIPRISSENRRYIPIGYMSKDVIANDKVMFIPEASLYLFGILISSVHNAWMRVTAGRLEMRYSYTPAVYNNFPWCNPTDTQKTKIEQTAQAILDARALYPDASLADLYKETTMPVELRRAHRANDEAVLAAYGWPKDLQESEIVERLFGLYEEMTDKNK
ncbi:MAG: N-6 DNA methylase [Salinivirgaceae bacterium]|nr:N-6 DNA methylase [Salinivirgaceae bacterium]